MVGGCPSTTTSDRNGNARIMSGASLFSTPCLPLPSYEGESPHEHEETLERERAYSDSMVRLERTNLLRSDISESRMSLCFEGEDPGPSPTSRNKSFAAGDVMTEPDVLPRHHISSVDPSQSAQEVPSSFLYHHHHQNESKYSSSMNVSTTPPPLGESCLEDHFT